MDRKLLYTPVLNTSRAGGFLRRKLCHDGPGFGHCSLQDTVQVIECRIWYFSNFWLRFFGHFNNLTHTLVICLSIRRNKIDL